MGDDSSLEPVEPEPDPETDRTAAPLDVARRRFYAAEFHYGPLPHPDHYERYADIIPDGANRLIALVEREQSQRHLMERLGMGSAFVLALAFLVAGSVLVLTGHDWAGSVIITSTVVALVGVFITGQLPLGRRNPPDSN